MIGEIVKRLRRVAADDHAVVYGHCGYSCAAGTYIDNTAPYRRDIFAFADAFLDPAPVTEDWLREIGGVDEGSSGEGCFWIRIGGHRDVAVNYDRRRYTLRIVGRATHFWNKSEEFTRGSLLAILFGLKLGPFAEEAERRIAKVPNA